MDSDSGKRLFKVIFDITDVICLFEFISVEKIIRKYFFDYIIVVIFDQKNEPDHVLR